MKIALLCVKRHSIAKDMIGILLIYFKTLVFNNKIIIFYVFYKYHE